MKFSLCGGLDAPEWLLAELSVVTKVSSVRIKLLAQQIVKNRAYGTMDYNRVEKLARDSGLDSIERKALVVSLDFIIMSAAKYDVEDAVVGRELQQLGLPREHAESITRSLKGSNSLLRKALGDSTLVLPPINPPELFFSESTPGQAESSVVMSLEPKAKIERLTNDDAGNFVHQRTMLHVSREKFRVLLQEMRDVKDILDNLYPEKS